MGIGGVSSYLLIGHWFEKDSAANASKKAFLTNRVETLVFYRNNVALLAVGAFYLLQSLIQFLVEKLLQA